MWEFVDTDNNPADDASRGIDLTSASADHRWFEGPEFLWKPEDLWPPSPMIEPPSEQDSNVRQQIVTCASTVCQNTDTIEDVIERIFKASSSWYRLKKYCVNIDMYRETEKRKESELTMGHFFDP